MENLKNFNKGWLKRESIDGKGSNTARALSLECIPAITAHFKRYLAS